MMAASQEESAVRCRDSDPPVDGMTTTLEMPPEVVKVCSQFDPKLQFILTFSVKPEVVVDVEESSDTRDATGNVRSNKSKKVDGGREGRDLPDEVLERIIERMPFPFLFKARVLSRKWFDLSCGDGGVGALVRCGDSVMVCICSASAMLCQGVSAKSLGTSIIYTCRDSIKIFRLDLEGLLLNEVCTGPPQVMASLCGSTMCAAFLEPMRISSDAKFLYFSWDGPDSPVVLSFDLQSLKWGHLPTAGSDCRSGFLVEHKICRGCSFQPGLNPFVMV